MSVLSPERACRLLNFQFEPQAFSARAKSVVSSQTKARVHLASAAMQRVQENFSGSGSRPEARDLKDVVDRFITLAPEGLAGLKRDFDRYRDVKHLAWALNYTDRDHPKSIMEGRHFSLALAVIGSVPQRRLMQILFNLLLAEWSQLPSGNRKLLQEWLKRWLSTRKDHNRFVRSLQKEPAYFLEEKGPWMLALEILKTSQDEVEAFLDPDRTKTSDQYESLPFFVNALRANSYFLEVATYAIDGAARSGDLLQLLSPLIRLADKRFAGPGLRKVLVPIILWIEDHPREGVSWKEQIKGLALSKVGDPYLKANWGSWPGIGEREKGDLNRAREVLNQWISESLISLFFEKMTVSKDRKEFWLPYAKKLSVRIFCSAADMYSLRSDSRIRGQTSTRFGQLIGSGSVLVMTTAEFLLIEFSTSGNAFYIYQRENLGKYGLKRLERVMNNEAEEPLSVYDIKKTNMPRISGLNPREGRFFHSGDWQYTLANWLKMYVGV